MTTAYIRSKAYSDEKLTALRQALVEQLPLSAIAITYGSYARREASKESDIDYLIVDDLGSGTPPYMDAIKDAINPIVPIEPSSDGHFGAYMNKDAIITNIGGDGDTNQTLTRRLLLLLEGEWLYNEAGFKELRRRLISKYLDNITDSHQLALFLLNDIIRYWRTMTVDYMYKIDGDKKPWAIRNIKLMFSRKLMYASGLFSIAMTADRSKNAKIQILEKLFDMPAIDRMMHICGSDNFSKALGSYNFFLEKMEMPDVRNNLKLVEKGDHNNVTFRELKDEGHHFTRELLKLLETSFHSTHPIHRAVLF